MKKLNEIIIWTSVFVAASLIIAGLSGLKLFLVLALVFVLPVYLIICQTAPKLEDKLIISLFISLGIIPSLTYGLGFIFGIKAAAIISSAILFGTSAVIYFLFKKKHTPKTNQ
jgi:hypothetical protein